MRYSPLAGLVACEGAVLFVANSQTFGILVGRSEKNLLIGKDIHHRGTLAESSPHLGQFFGAGGPFAGPVGFYRLALPL